MRSVLVWATAALVLGILLASAIPALPAGGCAVFAAGFAALAYLTRRSPVLSLACLLLPVALFGALSAQIKYSPAPDDVSRFAAVLPSRAFTGVVAAEPTATASGGVRYPLRVFDAGNGAGVSGALLVTQSEAAGLVPRLGDTVSVRGIAETPPGATNPGGFDYRTFLRRSGIFVTLSARHRGDVQIVRRDRSVSFSTVCADVRRAVLNAIDHAPLPEDDKALVAALLVSDCEGLPAPWQLAFERTGAVHLLRVSGLQFALLAFAARYCFRFLPARRPVRVVAHLALLALLWVWAGAAGLTSAELRAAVMATVILCAPLLRRDSDALHSLVVAAFVILVFDPLALYAAGFQFSFVCVGAAIVWGGALRSYLFPMAKELTPPARRARTVLLLLLTGTVIQTAAAPLGAFYYSLVSLIAPVAGVVLIPLAQAIVATALVTTGAGAVVPLPPFAYAPLHLLCDGIVYAALRLSALPLAAVSAPPPPAGAVIVFYVLFFAAGIWFRYHVRSRTFFPHAAPRFAVPRLAALPAFALVALPLAVLLPPASLLRAQCRAANRVRVIFLDVGQGDGAVIETPDGAVAVIDAGGHPGTNERYAPEPGTGVVVPFLRRRGFNQINLIVPTHPDDDHVQGLIAVAQSFPVARALDGGVPDTGTDACARLRALLKAHRVPITLARRGQTLPLGTSGVRLEILHPAVPFLTSARSVTNANSIVLRLRYKNAAILFTGDADDVAEESIVRSRRDVRADVLKAGHHGSRFSSGATFLAAVRPSVAVISVGAGNNFGHPTVEVLDRLGKVGAVVYRTDRDGAVTVETDGERFWVGSAR